MFDPKERLTDIKGKKYLEVKWRIMWFNEKHPDWSIETELTMNEQWTAAFCKCQIIDEKDRVRSTGHGAASAAGTRNLGSRFTEKAETAAVGRALAHLGYGTQFAAELEEDIENMEIVDAPLTP